MPAEALLMLRPGRKRRDRKQKAIIIEKRRVMSFLRVHLRVSDGQ